MLPGCVYGGGSRDRLSGLHLYTFTGLNAGHTYCISMRARDWNGGDPGDGLVSDQWSGQQCASVQYPSFGPVVPQRPGTPANVQAQFTGGA